MPRPSHQKIQEAARILGMSVDAVRRAVDAYFTEPPAIGRPPREFDGQTVSRALDGRSVREAARVLDVPESTLRDYFKRTR